MDALRSSVEDAFRAMMGAETDWLLLATLLCGLIAVSLFVLYLSSRRTGSEPDEKYERAAEPGIRPIRTSSVFSAAAAPVQHRELLDDNVISRAPARDEHSGRKAFLMALDSVEKVMAMFYIALLCMVLAAATTAMAWVYFRYPNDGNRDFMLFYAGVIYLISVLGLISQISATWQRLRRRSEPGVLEQLRPRMQITVESSPDVRVIDAAALERARRHLDGGGTVDEACALVDPRYEQMSGWSRNMFRKAIEMSLGKSA